VSASAKRHAQAIFQIALEKKGVDRWRSELDAITANLSDPRLRLLLESPKLSLKAKVEVVDRVLPGVSPQARNLVYLLVSRHRLALLNDIAISYQQLADVHQGVGHAEVTTAVPLSDSQKAHIAERLGAGEGKKVVVTNKVDPAIIGGFVARIDDKLIDGSIRAKLAALKRRLQETAVISS
ncbi:MAG: ATP synthase F1 subunit delta, partial [Chloroflexi bacterium]|nr:ATP synthase F1 subunit delta [Chloroflexota bacterium]